MKMVNETRKILHNDAMRVTATTVRVPVFDSHSESINVEFEKPFDLDELIEVLKNAPGVVVQNDSAHNEYPYGCYRSRARTRYSSDVSVATKA